MTDKQFSEWLNTDTDGVVGDLLRLSLLTALAGLVVGYLIGRNR